MLVETKNRIANSFERLDALLREIESQRIPKPDWIKLQGSCRLDQLDENQGPALLSRLHACVLRGFLANNVRIKDRTRRLEFWQMVTRSGFHNFSDLGWMKAYDSPFREDYDYIQPYLNKGLDRLDPYALYTSVLGTFDFSVEDFVGTELCANVETIVEPMAGTAEFAYHGHFFFPDFLYLMIDLDKKARQRVMARNWLPDTEKEYLVSDILEPRIWQQIKSMTRGESLAYIGKQSHHLFDARQMLRLMNMATSHVDYLMLETPQLASVTEMGGTNDMTRQEMKDAGFEVELIEHHDGEPNPFTNIMHFYLSASDYTGERCLFEYRDWTVWSQAILVTFARLLGLQALYFHSELHEFVPVEENWEDCDVEDNVTFMLFTRRRIETSD